MISVAEAQSKIAALLGTTKTEWIDLSDAGGRVLAQNAVAQRNQPPFAASAMDGYAVRAADLNDGARLRVVGQVAAGQSPDRDIGPREAIRIFTGAPVPHGADHILIQEDAVVDGDHVSVRSDRDAASYIRPDGIDFAEGDIMQAPRMLRHADVALLASMNCARIEVFKKPVVALVPTGDELVWPGETPRDDQIIASNNFGLAAMFGAAGADVRLLPIAADTPDTLGHVLDLAAETDLIVTLGGASVGDHDLVETVAHGKGLELSFYKLAMRPGKPLMAGRLGDAVLIGLPGNPVSSMVCGAIFVAPALRALQGIPYEHPPILHGTLAKRIGKNGPRTHYMRANVTWEQRGPMITAADRQDSSLLTVLSGANALLIRPPYAPEQNAGDQVQFCLLD